ncbi:unnamed protein product [Cuscuta europaea]|uniref:MATH domain-containing protein n=1 Tax=Cuscuta europaea TaxID=41803 RepID=A0A9P1A2R6_CUSEU|nr:unnamed protein product [Cuscuta europaea]
MSKFTWRIENFSKLLVKKLYSVTFVIDQYKWRLCLDPKGSSKLMYMYLEIADSSSLPNGWSIPAMYNLALINQIDLNKTIIEECEDEFNIQDNSWGLSLISLSKLLNKSEGFLVDDTCLVEVEVSVVMDATTPACNDSGSPVYIGVPARRGSREASHHKETCLKVTTKKLYILPFLSMILLNMCTLRLSHFSNPYPRNHPAAARYLNLQHVKCLC